MQQLLKIWNSLTIWQRVSLIVVPVVLCVAFWGLTSYKYDSSFRPLYTGLSAEDASAVTQKIREAGIEFRMDETGATVSVPAARIAEARMALAGAGLPRTGRIGFELFDRANLGASDFTEQVNYRRALEGELEKTVGTLAEVAQARIHLTFPKDSVFLDARQPAKATVVLQLRRASRIAQQNVQAIANLIASSVDGLMPEAVAIIDSSGRLLNRPSVGEDSGTRLAEADLEYRRQIESGLMSRINSALEPLLGAEKFRAGVNVDLDFTSTEENNETFDSGAGAMLASQTSEESNSTAQAGGAPGTASNLPRPAARSASGATGVNRRTENLTFQPSRMVRHVISPRGAVRRVSTAIVIDQTVTWEGAGPKAKRTFVPPSAEVLKGVHDIVAGIVGFTEQRGDQITVESLPFESTVATPPPAAPPTALPAPKPFDLKTVTQQPQLIGGVAALLVFLLAGAFLLLRRKKANKSKKKDATATDTAPGAIAAPEGLATAARPQLTSEERLETQLARAAAEQDKMEAEALSRISLPATTGRTDVLLKHIRESVGKDPHASASILRAWLAEKEGRKA